MAQFAAVGVAYAAEAESKRKLSRKIKYAEFSFACKILSNRTSTTLTMGEFILLEFMRLGCINADEIETIRGKFLEMDKLQKGELSLIDLHQIGAVILDKYSLRAGISSADLAALSASSYSDDGRRKSLLATNNNKKEVKVKSQSVSTEGASNNQYKSNRSVDKGNDQHTHHFEIDVEHAN